MNATICAFPSRKKGPAPWTNEELAELYRVVDILARAGLAVETDLGMSDEGDPWFVFCRADTGDVIAHFARIDGQFVAASVAVDETYKGANFRQIVDQMVRSQPLMLPPPSRGTRLLLHPAVILTAFVATALAHSEKAMAADAMRPVDAKWDHQADHHAAADHAHGKMVKPSWFESIQTMFRGAIHDSKINHEGEASVSGANQGISLASLIAIAMSAMQPLVDKLSFISEAVAGELHGQAHDAPAHQHSDDMAAAASLPTVDQLAVKGDSIVVKADAQADAAQPKKEMADQGGADQQKIVVDNHASAVPQQAASKAPAEDAPHKAAQPFDNSQDVNIQAAAQMQKMVAASAFAADLAPHADMTAVAAPAITLKDVSSQALQLLNIQVDPSSGSSAVILTKDQIGSDSIKVQTTGSTVDTTKVTPDSLGTVHYSTANGTDVINAIANFADSGHYDFQQPVQASADLQHALSAYADGGHPLKVIVFESSSLKMDIFSFAPGVVFVDEKYFANSPALHSSAGSVVLDLASGGSVTMVCVTTISQTTHA